MKLPRSHPDPVLRSVEDLVKAAQNGEREALHDLVVVLAPTLLSTVRRIVGARHRDVEDIAQDAAIHLMSALRTYRGECSLRHFACRIATHRALAARRNERYREEITPASDPQVLEDLAVHPATDDAAIANQKRRAIRALLDELPPAQAEVVALYFVMGLTAEEIAEVSGAGVPAVRGRIRLAREALRERIEGSPSLRDMLGGAS
jgi:RNA polymerase sigma-70 factor (ECF subfamily)